MSSANPQPDAAAYPQSDDDTSITNSSSRFREHSPPKVADLDMPFPYPSSIVPSSTAPAASPERTLDFFLKATQQPDGEALKRHAEKIQAEAYATWPYPCIRRWAFLTTKAAKSPVYPSVLSIGQSDPSAIYLDLGCFTGTDSRKLVADGWPAERVLGSDLRPEWFELGYKLYGDKGQCGVTFVAGDVFDDDFLAVEAGTAASSAAAPDLGSLHSLNALRGRVRCISAFSFFHLFDREPQLALARKLAVLLGPHPKPGSVIFGSHQGMRVPGNRRAPGQATLFGHSPDSWAEMWECEVFPASRDASAAAVGGGVKVKVWAELKDDGLPKMDVPGWRGENGQPMSSLMQWSVTVV